MSSPDGARTLSYRHGLAPFTYGAVSGMFNARLPYNLLQVYTTSRHSYAALYIVKPGMKLAMAQPLFDSFCMQQTINAVAQVFKADFLGKKINAENLTRETAAFMPTAIAYVAADSELGGKNRVPASQYLGEGAIEITEAVVAKVVEERA
jgi:hypothetical protein